MSEAQAQAQGQTQTQGGAERTPLQKAALVIKELRDKLDAAEQAKREPVAIVGMACRFPQSDGLDAYWKLLSEGRDAISEAPADRWDLEHFYDPNPNAPGKINTRYGGFIDNVDKFDAGFFGISPAEAERLDPQQRMLLEVAWHALEDAGQSPAALRGSRTGVFIGITQNDYGVMQLGGDPEDILAYTGTGNGQCFTAGRIAYVLGLHGPAFAVDTACSSSMVALHQACAALRNGECDAALVGGVQLNLTPPMQIFLSKTQSFSADGRCRTFDESAGGFVLGEGVGMIFLRRLSDAQSRGDRVRAVIRASGVNHDGPASGLTVPNEAAQEALLREVYAQAGVAPGEIDFVETHGTATELGDPIEVGALRSVFGKRPAGERPLTIGSVKTNLGHLSAAAGIAGLIKLTLMMQHEKMAPNLHFKTPSSRVPWEGFSVRVPTQAEPWPRGARPRRAGLSSFGLSGTNTHVLLEEAPLPQAPQTNSDAERPLHVMTLSARSEQALRELARAYRDSDALRGAPDGPSLADVCYSANAGRSHFACRLALRADSIDGMRAGLDAFANGGAGWSQVPRGGAGRLAMWFAADADVDAVRALAQSQPRVAATLARCAAAWHAAGGGELFNAAGADRAAMFAAQFALADLYGHWGMRPAAVAGCGIGALTALCMAGALDMEQGFVALAGAAVGLRAPQIPVYSGQDGSLLALAATGAYRLPAMQDATAAAGLQALLAAGCKAVLAVGGASAAAVAAGRDEVAGLGKGDASLWTTLADAVCALYLRGHNMDWKAFDEGYARTLVRLPGYVFQRQRFWLDVKSPVAKKAPPACAYNAAAVAAQAPASAQAARPAQDTAPAPAAVRAQAVASAPRASQDLSHLLNAQLESAADSINQVVAQQLAFLRAKMASPAAAPAPSALQPQASQTSPAGETAKPAASALGDWRLLMMAAGNEAALTALQSTLAESAEDVPLDGVKGEGAMRAILVHRGRDDAATALGKGGQRDAKRLIAATAKDKRSLVFMFPGVGDHYLRMAHGLYASDKEFREAVDFCCEFLKPSLGVDLREVLYPPQAAPSAAGASAAPAPKLDLRAMLNRAGPTSAPADPAEARLNQTVHCQPLVFIVEYALGRSWLARGIVPQAMIGYSIGEYAAACLAGVIEVKDALSLVSRRAQMIQELPNGELLAVPLAESKVLPLLGKDLSMCLISTPNQCVVGGPKEAVAALEAGLKRDEIVTRRLPGTHAFHSKMLAPLHDKLVELVSGFKLNAPRVPYVSNVTGDWITEQQARDPSYWARHTWQTVRFADGLGKLLDTEGRVFLEAGPGQSLGSFVLQHPDAQKLKDKLVLPSMRNRYENQPDEAYFLGTLGKLWLAGCKLD